MTFCLLLSAVICLALPRAILIKLWAVCAPKSAHHSPANILLFRRKVNWPWLEFDVIHPGSSYTGSFLLSFICFVVTNFGKMILAGFWPVGKTMCWIKNEWHLYCFLSLSCDEKKYQWVPRYYPTSVKKPLPRCSELAFCTQPGHCARKGICCQLAASAVQTFSARSAARYSVVWV